MLNKKNLDLVFRDDKPVKIISRIPENFAGKLAEKIGSSLFGVGDEIVLLPLCLCASVV